MFSAENNPDVFPACFLVPPAILPARIGTDSNERGGFSFCEMIKGQDSLSVKAVFNQVLECCESKGVAQGKDKPCVEGSELPGAELLDGRQ